ncbi:unnamed protein product [Durusdinium trenchii]|uniref:Ion transport domain-containing protein n=1 Tax=Durusdinium trenchii TaxID=1381693 RepID=A0ABP0RZY1_9DINO
MEALRLELTGHFSPDQPVPVPDVLNDAMENEEEPSEELSLSPMERWTTLTERLMDEHEWMTSVTGASPFGREKSHVHDLHMRRAWGTSIMSKRRTPAMRASVALPYANSALRINEAQTDSSFLSFFVVRPQSNMQLVWSIAACILIMWDMITIPLEFFDAGELQMVQNVVNIIAFVFWLLDMPLNCFFGVFRHGVVELRPKVLAGLCFRSWFGVDLLIITIDIARFIAEALLQGSMSSSLQGGRYLRALRILRLLRLTRIGKLQKKFALLANRFLSTYVFMVLKVIWTLTLMLAINHIIACCWYGVAMASIDEPTWLSNVNLDGSGTTSVFDSYVASLHWSLTQFTPSTNNIAPANALERSFAVFVILLAMGFFSSFVGSITSTVNSLRSLQAAKVKQQDTLLQFFVERNMSLDLYSKVQEVIKMEKLAEVRLHETDVALVNSLPERFRIQLHEEMYMHSVLKLHVWPQEVREDPEQMLFLRELCHEAMSERVVKRGEDLFLPGTDCEHAYILEPGFAMTYAFRASRSLVTPHDSVCLPCLWAEWHHCGRLTAEFGAGYFTLIRADGFASSAVKFGGFISRYLQIFGILYVGHLETINVDEVDDLGLHKTKMGDLEVRARSFCVNAKGSKVREHLFKSATSTMSSSDLGTLQPKI